jgi:diguanylate cyclase (GGDEF)-like protein
MRYAHSFAGIIKPLWVGLVLLNLAIVAVGTFELNKSKHQFEKQAVINTRNLSHVLEKSISALLDKIDLALLVSADDVERQMAAGRVDSKKVTDHLMLLNRLVPAAFNLRITNAKGDLLYGSDFSDLPVVNYADRDYFMGQRDNPKAGMFIGEPVLGKTTGIWLLTLSRRINRPDSSFGGVVFGTISLEHLATLFAEIDVGTYGSITLRDSEMWILASSGGMLRPENIVVHKQLSIPFAAALKKNPDAGSYISGSASIDGISRMHSYLRFEKYPLFINMGESENTYLAGWYKQVRETALLIIVFMLLSAVFSIVIIRLLRQQHAFQAELKQKAQVDFLTGVSNRGHFMHLAELELERAIRYGNDLSLFMLDMDLFKLINDRHGHKTGDLVLIKLAEVCRATLREVDVIGRVGGEEFAILLPETGGIAAADVAERLRCVLAEARVAQESGPPVQFTVSIGVSTLSAGDDNLDVLLSRADKALYEAKESGRNKVCGTRAKEC